MYMTYNNSWYPHKYQCGILQVQGGHMKYAVYHFAQIVQMIIKKNPMLSRTSVLIQNVPTALFCVLWDLLYIRNPHTEYVLTSTQDKSEWLSYYWLLVRAIAKSSTQRNAKMTPWTLNHHRHL